MINIKIDKENNLVEVTDNYGNTIKVAYDESIQIMEGLIKNIIKEML